MPCRPTIRRWLHSASSSPNSGNDRSGDAVRKTARRGSRSRSWPKIGSRNRIPFIHGQEYASPSPTQGGSRMRESRTYGSVRGALSNERPNRDRFARNDGLMRSPRHTLRPSSPANGSAEWPPDDRLRRATQYSEASVMESKSRGGRVNVCLESRCRHSSWPGLTRPSINLRKTIFEEDGLPGRARQ